MSYEMPFNICHIRRISQLRTPCLQGPALRGKLLRAALGKDPLTCLICLLNRLERVDFRNCHQLYSCWQFRM